MEISCNVIRDLLPLYAEDMVSGDSKKLVEEHLDGCEGCSRELAQLQKEEKVPAEVETHSLDRVKRLIRRKRIVCLLTVALFMVTAVLGVTLMMDAKIYLDAEDVVTYTDQLENGDIYVQFNNWPNGLGTVSNDEASINHGVVAYSSLYKMLKYSKDRPEYNELDPAMRANVTEEMYTTVGGLNIGIDVTKPFNIWYVNASNGRADELLWDGGEVPPEEPLADVNYHLAYYCFGFALLAAVLGMLARRFAEKWHGELFARISILCASVCISTVIVCAGQFVEVYGEFTENVINGAVLGLPMTLTGLFARQWRKLNRMDQGL